MKRKTEKDYHELAESRGFKWVGSMLPKNVRTKTWWECGKNKKHRWSVAYCSLQGCPHCCRQARKIEKDYHALAKSRGFKWVGVVLPANVHTLTLWECEKGDRWEARYNDIQQGNGCPYCAVLVKKTEKDYHSLAVRHGFKWVGPFPKNTHTRTWWECKNGHRWEAVYNSIDNMGSGCPICKDIINGVLVSKQQRKLNKMLTGSLNYLEARYRIDVAIMRYSQKIAVEYDCQHWHEGNEEYDTKRDNFLILRGWKVLHVKSSHLLPTRKQLRMAIACLLKTENKIYNLYLKDWK